MGVGYRYDVFIHCDPFTSLYLGDQLWELGDPDGGVSGSGANGYVDGYLHGVVRQVSPELLEFQVQNDGSIEDGVTYRLTPADPPMPSTNEPEGVCA